MEIKLTVLLCSKAILRSFKNLDKHFFFRICKTDKSVIEILPSLFNPADRFHVPIPFLQVLRLQHPYLTPFPLLQKQRQHL